jgi:hypothetical protein
VGQYFILPVVQFDYICIFAEIPSTLIELLYYKLNQCSIYVIFKRKAEHYWRSMHEDVYKMSAKIYKSCSVSEMENVIKDRKTGNTTKKLRRLFIV